MKQKTRLQVLCENTPTNPVPFKKRYKKIIYGVDEIDKKYIEHLDKISAKADDDKDPDMIFVRSIHTLL
jgi:hypothetical protein